jgi:hypothetical protein
MDYEMHSDPSRDEVWQRIMERTEASIREVSHDEARSLFVAGCGEDVDEFETQLLEGIESVSDRRLFYGSADESRVFLYCPAIDRGIWWGEIEGVTSRGQLARTGRDAARAVLEKKGLL